MSQKVVPLRRQTVEVESGETEIAYDFSVVNTRIIYCMVNDICAGMSVSKALSLYLGVSYDIPNPYEWGSEFVSRESRSVILDIPNFSSERERKKHLFDGFKRLLLRPPTFQESCRIQVVILKSVP